MPIPRCNWCRVKLNPSWGKYYCKKCKNSCERECVRCHRPFPSLIYFPSDKAIRCNACTRKYHKEKLSCDSSDLLSSSDISDRLHKMNTKNQLKSTATSLIPPECEEGDSTTALSSSADEEESKQKTTTASSTLIKCSTTKAGRKVGNDDFAKKIRTCFAKPITQIKERKKPRSKVDKVKVGKVNTLSLLKSLVNQLENNDGKNKAVAAQLILSFD